jgi:hypothetical protein
MEIDVLKMLERRDKWYLGGGNRLLWTPPFPLHLDRPGAWDFVSYFDLRIDPGYTISVVDRGVPVDFVCVDKLWNPATLRSLFRSGDLEMLEEKALLKEDFLVSRVTLKNNSKEAKELDIVVWTAQQCSDSDSEVDTEIIDVADSGIVFKKRLLKPRRRPYPAYVILALEGKESHNVSFSERTGNLPNFRLSPFYEKLGNDGLIERIDTNGINREGLLYIGLHRKVKLTPANEATFNCGQGAAPEDDEVVKAARKSLACNTVEESLRNWESYFRSLPQFSIGEPYLQKYYYYRWYGLKLFTGDVNESFMKHPAIAEGLDYFRAFITYSAQCHMLETRWSASPEVAMGSLLNFIENQRDDGSFTGHIYVNQLQENGFYHADWGRAVMELYRVHPDRSFIERIYDPMKKYLGYFDRVRDREDCGLYDVVDQFETGQEYMSRYTVVDPMADRYGWINSIRLKGVDATVYVYNLKKALAWMAGLLGLKEERKLFEESATKTKKAVLELMWDDHEEIFSDVNPVDFKRTGVKAAVCFYPYMTDIVDESHLPGLKKHLLNPDEFWTEYPVVSTSVDDRLFSQWAEWKGKRHNCPWNGRVWPMTNSHMVDVLGFCARRFDDRLLREKTVELVKKFIKMMYYEGDIERPNCFEHYNPFNGKACVYRGVDDYQHSWVVDLLFRYLAGIDFTENDLTLDPFPFGIDFELDNLTIAGKKLRIRSRKGIFEAEYNGKTINRL